MNEPLNISILTDDQLVANILQLAIQEVAVQQTKSALVNELVRRQVQHQQESTHIPSNDHVILPKLRKIEVKSGSLFQYAGEGVQ